MLMLGELLPLLPDHGVHLISMGSKRHNSQCHAGAWMWMLQHGGNVLGAQRCAWPAASVGSRHVGSRPDNTHEAVPEAVQSCKLSMRHLLPSYRLGGGPRASKYAVTQLCSRLQDLTASCMNHTYQQRPTFASILVSLESLQQQMQEDPVSMTTQGYDYLNLL